MYRLFKIVHCFFLIRGAVAINFHNDTSLVNSILKENVKRYFANQLLYHSS